MVEQTRVHERLPEEPPPGRRFELDSIFDRPVALFVPDRVLEGDSDGVRLVIHFHGAAFVPEIAVARSAVSSASLDVNVGSGSGVYQRAFEDPANFDALIGVAVDSLSRAGIETGSDPEIVLTAWSAGYGAVRAILKNRSDRISTVILLDGLHTSYIPERTPLFEGGAIDGEQLEVFLDYARQAINGSKRMLITHSEIFPGTFSSTTETTDYLIERLGLKREPILEWGPGGMQLLSRTESGGLTILGFAGNTAPDHVDHFHGLPTFLNMIDSPAKTKP